MTTYASQPNHKKKSSGRAFNSFAPMAEAKQSTDDRWWYWGKGDDGTDGNQGPVSALLRASMPQISLILLLLIKTAHSGAAGGAEEEERHR